MDKKPTAELIAWLRTEAKQFLAKSMHGAFSKATRGMFADKADGMKASADRLAELEAALKWKDMDSAPKDGTAILAYCDGVDGLEVRKVRYTTYRPQSLGYQQGLRDYWWEYIERNTCFKFMNPLGWMDMPQALQPKEEGK